MHFRCAGRLRAALHCPLGRLPLRRRVRRLARTRVGGRPGGRLQKAQRRSIRARLERHVSGVHPWPANGAGGGGEITLAALCRLPEPVQKNPLAAFPCHLRHPDAGHRAADDHPEHPRRRGGAPELQPVAFAHRRAGHFDRVQPDHGHRARISRQLHGAQPRFLDDGAVFQAHDVAAVFLLCQAQDRRHHRPLPGKPDDPCFPDRVDRHHVAQPADGVYLLYHPVPLQRQADPAPDRLRHPDHGRHGAGHPENQGLRARSF